MYQLRTLRSHIRTFHHRQNGDALIEFGITCIAFLALIVGVAEFAIAMYTYYSVSYSAQQAGRYAIVRGAHWSSTPCSNTNVYEFDCDASSTNVQNYVRALASPGINPSSITVTTTWPGTGPSGSTTGCSTPNSTGCMVQITVQYPFAINLPLIPHHILKFSASSQMIIQE